VLGRGEVVRLLNCTDEQYRALVATALFTGMGISELLGQTRAAARAGLEDSDWPPLRFHDLRHTFASHLIVDLGLDVAQSAGSSATPRSPRR
jgi:integrase